MKLRHIYQMVVTRASVVVGLAFVYVHTAGSSSPALFTVAGASDLVTRGVTRVTIAVTLRQTPDSIEEIWTICGISKKEKYIPQRKWLQSLQFIKLTA